MGTLPPNIFSRLSAKDIDFLGKPVANEKIKKTLFDINPLKAPNNDGYQEIFFQTQWDIVGSSVFKWVQGIFGGKSIDIELNNSLLVLIPKKNDPTNFSQFRPISLCFVMYKLVMKVIANRFKLIFSNIISQKQAEFTVERHISNNVIIAQEIIHSTQKKNKRKVDGYQARSRESLRSSQLGIY